MYSWLNMQCLRCLTLYCTDCGSHGHENCQVTDPRVKFVQAPDTAFRVDISRGLQELARNSAECASILTAKLLAFLPSVPDSSATCQVDGDNTHPNATGTHVQLMARRNGW
jgi:hypothetical protein